MPLSIDPNTPDCRRRRWIWFCRSLCCSFISFTYGALTFLLFFCHLFFIVGLSNRSQEYGPQPLHESRCLLRRCCRLCLCFLFDAPISMLGAIVRVKRL